MRRESVNFIFLQIYHVRICARSAIDICTNCGCISAAIAKQLAVFSETDGRKEKKKKGEKNPDYFWFHPLFLIYVLRIEGKPEFHFHDSIPQPMLHVDEILTLLFFSRKRSFNTPVEFSISVPQEQQDIIWFLIIYATFRN